VTDTTTGLKKYIKDAVIAARLESAELFASKNIFIVPVTVGEAEDGIDVVGEEGPRPKGFSYKEDIMTAPYIGRPAQVLVPLQFPPRLIYHRLF